MVKHNSLYGIYKYFSNLSLRFSSRFSNLYYSVLLILIPILFPLYAGADVVYTLGAKKVVVKSDVSIVSLAPSITEILYFLGLMDNIKGVTRYDDFPEGVKEKEIIGGYLDVDVEKVLKIRPDVVICEPNSGIKDSVEYLNSKGVLVLVVQINSIMDILNAIEELGVIFKRDREATSLLNELTSRYINLQRFLRYLKGYSALIILNEDPLMVAGKGTFVGEILNISGLTNAYQGGEKYPVIDREMLIKMRPDFIFNISEATMSGGQRKRRGIGTAPLFMTEARLFDLSDTSFIRPSPRFIEAVERVCSLIDGYFCY